VRLRSILVPAIAVLVVLAAPAGAALAAGPAAGTIVNVELELPASNGLRARLETSDKGMVTLEFRRKYDLVSYEVKGRITQEGLKARFGRLGLIDVAFTPTRTLSATAPSEGCTGAPRTLREGTFSGTIDFTGERNFVRIDAPRVEGTMSVVSQWQCPQEPVLFTRPAWPLARTSASRAVNPSVAPAMYRALLSRAKPSPRFRGEVNAAALRVLKLKERHGLLR
jgi:hypothetical protein